MKKQSLQRGVTLVELVVVITIVAVVSAVIVFNYSSFRTNVSLRDLAQEVALSVRKAQTYATSVRNLDTGTSESGIYPAYGISFSADTNRGATTPYDKQFVLFADIPKDGEKWGDGMYTSNGTCINPTASDNECAEPFTIVTGDRVASLCADIGGGGIESCFTDKGVDVVFRRPSPDANICIVSGGGCLSEKPSYVKVVLQSANGLEKRVTIWNTGQISAE